MSITARSLWLITEGESKISAKLPESIGGRHRLCASLASKFKDLGYRGECGYNQFLYPAESSTRDMLLWLVDKLPKSEEERTEEILGSNALLNRKMMARLEGWSADPWRLHFCSHFSAAGVVSARHNRRAVATRPLIVPSGRLKKLKPERRAFFESRHLRPVTRQIPPEDEGDNAAAVAASVFEHHSAAAIRAAEREKALMEAGLDSIQEYRAHKERGLKGLIRGAFAQAHAAPLSGDSRKDGQTENLASILSQLDGEAAELARQRRDFKGSRFSHQTDFGQEQTAATTEAAAAAAASGEEAAEARRREAEEAARKRAEELEALQASLEAHIAALEALQKTHRLRGTSTRNLEAEIAAMLARTSALEREVMVKQKTLDMLPQAAENIGKLQQICAASAERLLKFGHEWENHRVPLVNEVRQAKEAMSLRKSRCRQMVADMKRCRGEMQEMAVTVREKEQRAMVLAEEYERMPKNVNRTLYTYRIMDIISSIAKQKSEIKKVVGDIRNVQRDINTIGETLRRTEAIAEERVYQSAEKAAGGVKNANDPAQVKAYRALTDMRQHFEQLLDSIARSGRVENESRDIEVKMEQLQGRISNNNVEQIANDLGQVRRENKDLLKRLRAAAGR